MIIKSKSGVEEIILKHLNPKQIMRILNISIIIIITKF